MKIVADTHTHTMASGHAYCTFLEMAKAASEKENLELIAVTDHGPLIPGASELIYFGNLNVLPDEIFGVKILKGVEANILYTDEIIDIPEKIAARLDFVMAGFHMLKSEGIEKNTEAMINAVKLPYVNAISHPGNPKYPIDTEAFVSACKKYHTAPELNNYSFIGRKGSKENCYEIARACKKQNVPVVCGSDAHYTDYIGGFENVYKLIKEIDFPEELVLNSSVEKLQNFIRNK